LEVCNINELSYTAVIALLSLVGGIVGYCLRYYLDKKKEIISDNIKIKIESYKEFVDV